jgi:hypothetical protein
VFVTPSVQKIRKNPKPGQFFHLEQQQTLLPLVGPLGLVAFSYRGFLGLKVGAGPKAIISPKNFILSKNNK